MNNQKRDDYEIMEEMRFKYSWRIINKIPIIVMFGTIFKIKLSIWGNMVQNHKRNCV